MRKFACLLLGLFCLATFAGCAESEIGSNPPDDPKALSTDILSGLTTEDVSSEGTEYLWRVSIPTGTEEAPPRPYLVVGGKQYEIREDTPEVEKLSSDWELIGTVNVSIDWRENTYDIDPDENTIVSNCVSKGAKVYKWNYFVAVECPGFFVVFQESSFS